MQDIRHLFIIGAPKAGTTTLAQMLAEHPDIHQGAIKEPRFFTDFAARSWSGPGSRDFETSMVTDLPSYRALYAGAARGSLWLDASTDYLSNAAARDRLVALARDNCVKLICLLRDPVDRIVSEYQHTLRDLLESESLQEALAHEEARRRDGWQPLFWHRRRSAYHADVTAYKAAFGEDLLILDFAELRDPSRIRARIYGFLGLSLAAQDSADRADPAATMRNKSHSYRSPRLQRALANRTLRHAARQVAPRRLRHWLGQHLARANRTQFHPTEADLRAIHAALADDIRACLADPGIPTESWTLARRLTQATGHSPAPVCGQTP
ncbi:MAG: sulfotransferase [Rhodobacteraceae bacterium]|nr:MAG: sulfotransferase [Paracoccaceae bacterium]